MKTQYANKAANLMLISLPSKTHCTIAQVYGHTDVTCPEGVWISIADIPVFLEKYEWFVLEDGTTDGLLKCWIDFEDDMILGGDFQQVDISEIYEAEKHMEVRAPESDTRTEWHLVVDYFGLDTSTGNKCYLGAGTEATWLFQPGHEELYSLTKEILTIPLGVNKLTELLNEGSLEVEDGNTTIIFNVIKVVVPRK